MSEYSEWFGVWRQQPSNNNSTRNARQRFKWLLKCHKNGKQSKHTVHKLHFIASVQCVYSFFSTVQLISLSGLVVFFSAVAAFYNCINRKQWKQRHRHYMYRASEWWNDTEPESQLIVNVGS